ncbi:serine/threonine-protein kinase [Spongiactinospora sp. TRM90649]|uniref:serine/threonine-protein kinase n=1 Tax=Spongiactinospora sp. TRM90649 TaxID=3031114 RepID=UPI0023F91808|nr:serine/threonine-protein kinase [Spongiactinospora sp. TRM90649]MDF5751887.1 tetratricopeptide repeat protein [Spongiactinospora sp. TRM90649]
MTACTHPGCTGTVQDGYCDTCGLAPPAAPVPEPPRTGGRHAAPQGGPAYPPPGGGPAYPPAPGSGPLYPPPPASGPVYPSPGSAPVYPPGTGQQGPPPSGPAPQPFQQYPSAGAGQAPPPAPPYPHTGQVQPQAPPQPQAPQAPGASQPSMPQRPGSTPVSGWQGGSAPVSAGWRGRSGIDLGTAPSTGPVSGRGTSSTRSRRSSLGASLVEVPPVPYRDPSLVVMRDPEVPEHKRYCSNGSCGKPVGRAKGDRPGRAEGFCPHCGNRFSFTPKLNDGDLVAGQYEVKGCLAHGGLGWIYLAADLNLDGRWVVLKGLLDTGDVEALLAAEAERRFLTSMDHANIVRIFNFVQHPDPTTGTMVGYIVMEYVGGQSLQDMLKARLSMTANREALPVAQAIAYILEVLKAFDYLHDRQLLYCDLKPANIIQVEDQLKLIDLGAVRRIDDQDSSIYGTVGYQAPEIAKDGPSVSSDLYTVGRMLAVLSMPFSPAAENRAAPLPTPDRQPLLATYESFDRFLHRATDPNPARRFQSAQEMSEQLTGILREIRAAEDGRPRPALSTEFGPERLAAATTLAAEGPVNGQVLEPLSVEAAVGALSTPLVDPGDQGAGFLAGITARTLDDLVTMLDAAPVASIEIRLALIRALIEQRNPRAGEVLEAATRETPWDWRVLWYHALRELAWGNLAEAVRLFDEVYFRMPGERAPRLALAFARECAGDHGEAARHYAGIWRTDRAYVSAAFGLARVCLAMGDRASATRVLDEVPTTSSHYISAQMAAVALAIRGRDPGQLPVDDLMVAGERLADLRLDAGRHNRMAAEVLEVALTWLSAGGQRGTAGPPLLGATLSDNGVRKELERVYRALARGSGAIDDRHAYVDKANAVRPRTWV